MKKFYYITLIAITAIICIQIDYTNSLYDNYKEKEIIKINDYVHISIDEELHIRGIVPKSINKRCVVYKRLEDMTPLERDSLLKITKPGDTIYIDQAREQNIGTTVGEIVAQLSQDQILDQGRPLNLDTLNHIFSNSISRDLTYRIVQYDQDTLAIDSVGYSERKSWNYVSELFPIGTKGLVFLQVKAAIPWFEFVCNQLWNLITSLGIMLITFVCLAIQLIEIKRQNELLRKREATINGTIHDLKSPLNSVVTMLSWFKTAEKDPQKRKMIETALSSVKHLVYTIESLLVIARKDKHQIVLNKTKVDIPKLVERNKQELAFLYPEKYEHIRIINQLPEGFTVPADTMYIDNVIRNLLENAMKYSDEDVEVTVTLETKGQMLSVSVKDNGWGIAPQHQKKLFTQFYQVPRDGDKLRRGYGIGLAQAKYIINEHQGEIKVSSEENKGSLFSFTLPLQ